MVLENDPENIRKDYRLKSLLENDVDADPVKQFETWWKDAVESKIGEPNAMTLCTSSPEGKPSARIVLLKGIRNGGFVFYSNYESNKGKQINKNPLVALVFFWKELERQVRIEGSIEQTSNVESDGYFANRPAESRIGAWSSPQSKVIDSRDILEENMAGYRKKFDNQNIPRPPYWGGYIVNPDLIEFWQGRTGRLHDRLQYTRTEKVSWKIERLAP